jgi:hypothetical protein
MNAERLHAIIEALRAEMSEKNLVTLLQNLVGGLRQVVQVVQQSNASTQQSLSSHLTTMYKALEDSAVDRFSPAWKQVLLEIGGDKLFGAELRHEIEDIIAKNQMTPSVAADRLEEIRSRMDTFRNALNQGSTALGTLKIGDESLKPGDCEIGMLIPRAEVDNRMIGFAKELEELGFVLNTFSEVATGHPDNLTIRTISSSDLLVYLNAGIPFAAIVAVAIERIVALYKNLLDIRKLQTEIEKQGITKAAKDVEEHANDFMEKGIGKLSIEIVNEFYKGGDAGRKNELRNGVNISLNMLASRVDRGYNFEVRCQPLPAGKPEKEETKRAIAAIQAATANMQFLKLEGKPILKLPEKTGQAVRPGTRAKGRGKVPQGKKESQPPAEQKPSGG